MGKQTLFISYNWEDGNSYADELETQLGEEFDIRRDKSQLIANDDIYEFMGTIANCDNILIILTKQYVKSLNCMLEVSYLLEQSDWGDKITVLVIDESIYSLDRKLEIIAYWRARQTMTNDRLRAIEDGKKILEVERGYIDQICKQVENFLIGIARRKNPSQIAVVSEVIKKSKRDRREENAIISRGEEAVLSILKESGHLSVSELSEHIGKSRLQTSRLISSLASKNLIEKDNKQRNVWYVVKTQE